MEHSLIWRKASLSGANGAQCVETAFTPAGRALGLIRDSKNREAGHLAVSTAVFATFIADIRAGHFDSARLAPCYRPWLRLYCRLAAIMVIARGI